MTQDAVDQLLDGWRRERPDLDLSAMATVGRLLRAAAVIRASLAETASRHGLGIPEGDILFTLRRSGEPYRLAPSALSSSLLVSSGTLTNRLDRLEARGLIKRVPHPSDRRSTQVELSREGFELADEIVGEHVENERRMLAGLSEGQREELDDLLRALLAGFPTGPTR